MNNELLNIDINNAELAEFTNTVLQILGKHAPIKRKFIHGNNSAFMAKELKAVNNEIIRLFLITGNFDKQ